MLERVALHQTRLRVPGVGLDPRGIALGAHTLVLVPSLERLVQFLAVLTERTSLESYLSSLKIEVVRSKLGTREIVLRVDAGSSERADQLAEIARVADGFVFTGADRHYVQYRDENAPFGYDADEISKDDADYILYHTTFSQAYRREREVELLRLLRALTPVPAYRETRLTLPIWVLAESGVGPRLLSHFLRSGVRATAGVVEWPSDNPLEALPVRRWLFDVQELPERLHTLLKSLPGVTLFRSAGPGVGVEFGFQHPLRLAACPLFDTQGLVLFRRSGAAPLDIAKLPVLSDIRTLSRVDLPATLGPEVVPGTGSSGAPVAVPFALMPSAAAYVPPQAIWIRTEELAALRRLAYSLPAALLRETRAAVTDAGVFLTHESGIDAIPLGQFFQRIHPSLFIPLGYAPSPAVDAQVLFTAFGAPADREIFVLSAEKAVALERARFGPLMAVLLEPAEFQAISAQELNPELATPSPSLWLEPLGVLPMSGAEPVK